MGTIGFIMFVLVVSVILLALAVYYLVERTKELEEKINDLVPYRNRYRN